MSKTRKDIQEQLQKDEVAETLQNILSNFRRHRNLMITMGVIVVLGFLVNYALRAHNEQVLTQSNDMMSTLTQGYDMLVSQPESKDPKQRDEKLKGVVDASKKLSEAYPDTKLGREAIFIRGNAYYQLDKFPEAQKEYQGYLDKAQTPEERAKASIALGYAYENDAFLFQGKTPQETTQGLNERLKNAQTNYEAAISIARPDKAAPPVVPYLYYYALMCQGRLDELTLHNAEAKAIYEQIVKERPEPVVKAKEKAATDEQNMMTQMLRKQLDAAEGQMSFYATAKTRLDRLNSTPQGPAPVTAEAKATPAAPSAASPAAAAAATPAATVVAPVKTPVAAAPATPAVAAPAAVAPAKTPAAAAPATPAAATPAAAPAKTPAAVSSPTPKATAKP